MSGKQNKSLPLPQDFRTFEGKLELRRSQCKHTDNYAAGRIFIDPIKGTSLEAIASALEQAIGFTGLFRCSSCGAGGPWQLPEATHRLIMALHERARRYPKQAQIFLGRLQLFDGTVPRSGAASEEHLKRLIAENPDDYFPWSRPGLAPAFRSIPSHRQPPRVSLFVRRQRGCQR